MARFSMARGQTSCQPSGDGVQWFLPIVVVGGALCGCVKLLASVAATSESVREPYFVELLIGMESAGSVESVESEVQCCERLAVVYTQSGDVNGRRASDDLMSPEIFLRLSV